MIYHPFRHLGLKALSVGIAVLLWLTVAGEPVVERGLRIPLELRGTPEELELVEGPPSQVDVRVRGASSVLSHLDAGDVVAVLDVDQASPGSHVFHLTPAQLRVPYGVEVIQVIPSSVTLKLERTGAKVVPIVAVTSGTPAAGFEIGQIVLEPPTVEVAGPESALKLVREALTEAVSVQGASAPIEETVTIAVADARLRLVTAQRARASVEIKPIPLERTLTDVPVLIRNAAPPRRARVTPSTARVLVRGPKDVVSELGADSVVLFVDVAGLGPGRHSCPLRAEPVRDVEIVRTQPATVFVVVQ
jgi:YbbR domain-containing protein